ncbi:GIY-YIG nuclease family protein [Zhengella sp. ZM62]|uniref:GIY-YIG nuclease family protein n=1 Tax=Zhengella sedimenti TaxID=3390035 RepID=UPI0039756191
MQRAERLDDKYRPPATVPDGPTPTFIYFFVNASETAVKIGHAANIINRFRNIQNGNPEKLDRLYHLYGDPAIEGILHEQFREHRLQGEWFRYHGGISDDIDVFIDGIFLLMKIVGHQPGDVIKADEARFILETIPHAWDTPEAIKISHKYLGFDISDAIREGGRPLL